MKETQKQLIPSRVPVATVLALAQKGQAPLTQEPGRTKGDQLFLCLPHGWHVAVATVPQRSHQAWAFPQLGHTLQDIP